VTSTANAVKDRRNFPDVPNIGAPANSAKENAQIIAAMPH
jgi:hypothetical protein